MIGLAVTDYAKLCKEHNDHIMNEVIETFELPNSPHFVNRVGQRYEKLEVIKYVGMAKHAVYYLCRCECGNEKIVKYASLCSGNTTSCGCTHQEKMRKKMTTHGMAGQGNNRHPLYKVYSGMKSRCYNPNHKYWSCYGKRGITICDEWIGETGYLNFYNWAMENGYEKGLTIDRIDTDKGYSPDNCRWTDSFTQGNNTSANTYMTCGFYTFTISIWCKITGLTNSNVMYRKSCGWTDEEIICTPRYKKRGEEYRILPIPQEFMKFNKYNEFHKDK